ncbi:hypothetical protein FG93_05472 [Bosea sp. LC85]|uniref:hypothetical protein n=1 Tax=Bosea sp. LC85 TaxID=1502851 RepID=UPI0004E42F70|nr:hypothetical protein [Bosea sp. LC85]KFC63962.1 hypothetical protein FG93_05472 [Bosea sp. LC85]
MITLLRAGLMALALFAVRPASAEENCRSLDSLMPELVAVAAMGARVVMLDEAEAKAALGAIEAERGPPPRPLKLSAMVLIFGDQRAVVLFVEGTEVCLLLPLGLESARRIEAAARGEPA